MNRIPRFIIWIIAAILIISSLLFIYYSFLNRDNVINSKALSNNIPIVVSSDEPLEFINLIDDYSDIDGVLPVNSILDSKSLFEKIQSSNIQIISAAWLFDHNEDKSAVLISSEKDITSLISNNADNTTGWVAETVNGFALCAHDQSSLKSFGELVKGSGSSRLHQNSNSSNKIFIQAKSKQFNDITENTQLIFDITEYKHTLHINGVPNQTDATVDTKIPVSGSLSEPELFAGNPFCFVQYSKNNDNPVISLQLSSGRATPVKHNTTKPVTTSNDPNVFASLNSPIKRGPFLVDNHKTDAKSIIAFDIENTMYLFDEQGALLWQKQFPDEIVGDVLQVDKFNNKRFQFLWNSKNNIHLIDINGNEVEGYPFAVPGQTRKGISLVHFKGYTYPNILYINNDGKVMNLNLTPAIVPDWNITTIDYPVSVPISYLNSGSDHYVIIAGDNGQVTMLKKTGHVRMKIKKSFVNNALSDFYFNKTNSKGNLITTNNKGALIYIPKTGGVSSTNFGSFSEDHYFFYFDFDNDKNNDFVFVDKNKITAFNRFKKKIFSQDLTHTVSLKPEILSIEGKSVLGIVDNTQSAFNIYGIDGKMSFDIPCEENVGIHKKSKVIYSAVGKNIYKNNL